MKHQGLESKEKIDVLSQELKDMYGEMEALELLNMTLLITERKSNDQLQDPRKELINGFSELDVGRGNIGIKRVGELDFEAFRIACRKRSSEGDTEITSAVLCSKWQEEIKNPSWHPFKVKAGSAWTPRTPRRRLKNTGIWHYKSAYRLQLIFFISSVICNLGKENTTRYLPSRLERRETSVRTGATSKGITQPTLQGSFRNHRRQYQ
ncbi:hypothetical protein GQ55_5G459100 [Panicum hallii var. hallii]|uniref:Factor of DNA methylation 1-5/IDN2 domain-containing protein n=1 Tax=Panicum hallii var. hallii TaxID=1504633 RepID=A0A2T7DQF5_9POAL|nr:hypothetical protein GQ55_5G459100 [Panicum hallii var. hallii]